MKLMINANFCNLSIGILFSLLQSNVHVAIKARQHLGAGDNIGRNPLARLKLNFQFTPL